MVKQHGFGRRIRFFNVFKSTMVLWISIVFLFGTIAFAAEEEGGVQYEDDAYQEDYLMEEMIVTASKRPRKLQEVPISIYAVTGDKMESAGINSLGDMSDAVAGVEIISTGTGTVNIAARGVTNMAGGIESTAAVGYYLDEVPVSSLSDTMPEIAMWDVDRVEVLRGPQGTLFGEGSMAGTIRVITNKPDSTEFSSRMAGDISSTEMGGINYSVKGMINVPLVEDKLALRALASYSDRNGWIDVPDLNKEDANESSQLDIRIAALWTPNEKLTVDGSIYYQSQDIEHGAFETSRGVFWPFEADFLGMSGPANALDPIDIDYYVANLTLTYDFGIASLVSATSYFDSGNDSKNDLTPILPFFLPPDPRTTGYNRNDITVELWTQELRLVSNGDERLDWTVGGFYKNNDREAITNWYFDAYLGDIPIIPDDLSLDVITSEVTAYALFADVDYELTDKFSIDLGVRYYVDDREYKLNQIVISGFFGGVPGVTSVSADDSATTPAVSLNWKPNDDVLVFVKAAKGFRGGGTNPNAVLQPQYGINPGFGPEELWSYEGGVKTTWSGLTLNAYLYYNDWTDLQLSFATPD
ncbi:MAG: TonB-dependent receptor, partial [Deltaproteobacteria bacterium]|nr:TonB-dependent receptor [Deltaproteobacteria bacterium]